LHELLTHFRPFAATDPRDKVYALLGIASAVEHIPQSLLPAISYHPSTTVLDVLWEVVATHLRVHQNLDFLDDAYGMEGDGVEEGWPSWMPLWYQHDDDDGTLRSLGGCRCRWEGWGSGLAWGGIEPVGGARAVVAGMDKGGGGTLIVAGKVLGLVGMVPGEVFDQDVERMERLAVRRRWAGLFGLEGVEALRQVLTGLRCAGRIGEGEAKRRMEEALGGVGAGGEGAGQAVCGHSDGVWVGRGHRAVGSPAAGGEDRGAGADVGEQEVAQSRWAAVTVGCGGADDHRLQRTAALCL
ncbi:hypothetical protein C8A01DRAFT_17424, partial [Parachaetomium inaequale]